MTNEEKNVLANEIAKTYELYGFEISFSEFKDVFELGAEFGYKLAMIQENKTLHKENTKYAGNEKAPLRGATYHAR